MDKVLYITSRVQETFNREIFVGTLLNDVFIELSCWDFLIAVYSHFWVIF